jgi:hypothetical protein
MRQIPIINRQALGNAMTVPGIRSAPPRVSERKIALGQMGPSIGGGELVYRGAVDNLEGVKKAYSKLIALLGDGDAAEILEEAQKAVEKAQADYVKQIPQK